MIPRFSLTRARDLDEAFEAFASAPGDAAYLAGGTELLQVMKMGLAQFGHLVDVKAIGRLRGVAVADGMLRVGALTTHRELERSVAVARTLPALAELEGRVANVRVRNQGTIGGNLAFAEPHSDPATLLLACGARLELVGPAGTRRLGVDEFVLGPLLTARNPEELVVSIDIPVPGPGQAVAFDKIAFFERPAVSAAVRLTVVDGEVTEAAVAVGSIGDVAGLVPDAAAELRGARPDDLGPAIARARERLGAVDATADLNGSPDYKRHLAGVLLERVVRRAHSQAAGA